MPLDGNELNWQKVTSGSNLPPKIPAAPNKKDNRPNKPNSSNITNLYLVILYYLVMYWPISFLVLLSSVLMLNKSEYPFLN